MMAALWSDVAEDLASAHHHFTQALAIAPECGFDREDRGPYVYVAGFMYAMQSGYTSFEAALKRVYAIIDEPLAEGQRLACRDAAPRRKGPARLPARHNG